MNPPITPIAYSVVHSEYSTVLVCLYPFRSDWLGFSLGAHRTYHILAFDCDTGASEENVAIPEEFGYVIGREAAEDAFRSITGVDVPEWAFEGRVG